MTLILGSQSPRRREILSYFSLPYVATTPPFDEEQVLFKGNPQEFAMEISRGKALALAPQYPIDPILTADTVVYCEGQVYAKPASDAEALAMLKALAGRWHSVFTGLTLKTALEEHSLCEETRVLFHAASDEQLHKYHKSLHLLDKAGAYAIQQAGGIITRRIEGCYYNVMGLPLAALATLLMKIDIDLWDYLR